jgi:hypothetical protein
MSVIRSNSNSSESALAKWWAKQGLKSSIDVLDKFRFYKFNLIEYGNWVNQELRNDISMDILKGCSEILQPLLKTKNLGVDGSINIAIGSRGKRGVLGYFQPSTLFISFNKYRYEYDENTKKTKKVLNKGNSFVHEYFHALDYIIGRFIEPTTKANMLSDTFNDTLTSLPIRQAMSYLLKLFYLEQMSYNKDWLKNLTRIEYWNSPAECFVRISEQCVCYYALQKKIKQNVTKPMAYYLKNPNRYMPKKIMLAVYPLWIKVINLFSMVLQGKNDEEIRKYAEKNKGIYTKTEQGSLFDRNISKKKAEKTKKKSPNSKKKTTKTKKK